MRDISVERRTVRSYRPLTIFGDPADQYFSELNRLSDRDLFLFAVNSLTPDAVVLDIGANIGVTSSLIADVVTDGKVYAIEAGRRNFGWLETNIGENCRDNIEPVWVAISDKAGTVQFDDYFAWGGIKDERSIDTAGQLQSVEAITLDALVDNLNLATLDFIKIDIEGHEPAALAGAKKTLDRFDPVVLIEFNSWQLLNRGSHNARTFLEDLLEEFQFVARLTPDGSLERVTETNMLQFLREHLKQRGALDDLVLRRSPDLPTPSPSGRTSALRRLGSIIAENEAQEERVQAAIVERDAARKQLRKMRNSKAWKTAKRLRKLRHPSK